MRKYLLLLSLLAGLSALAQDDDTVLLGWPHNVQARLDRLVEDTLLDRSQLGLMVYDLTDQTPLYTFHARHALRPASTMKLVTAIAALDYLGGDYLYRTSLFYEGTISGGKLTGDLICRGGMDPTFSDDDMGAFVDAVRQAGIDTICGRLLADVSMKDTLRWGEGWCWDDKNPPLSPLLISRTDDFTSRLALKLAQVGIVTDSMTLGEGRQSEQSIRLFTLHRPIELVLTTMMKESDNLYAESMFYQLAAFSGKPYAGADDARRLERQLISRLGIAPSNYRIADGSGLSLYNYVTPELLTSLLVYAWQRPSVIRSLYPSLPVAGVDGTLKRRMQKTVAQGNVRAKTGTLSGIISLAGYCTASNGHELAFCIINQGVLSATAARNYQNRVCIALCQ